MQWDIPQITLVGPPEVKLRDKLVDNAVHDYHKGQSIKVLSGVGFSPIGFFFFSRVKIH
jgi:hypothetical protein